MAHDHEIYMTLAEIAMELRDVDALHKYAPALEKLATRDQHGLYLAIAHRAWGVAHRLAGDSTQAENRLQAALEIFMKLGAHWQIGRTLFELGELHFTRSNEKAREYYLQALEAFEEIHAVPNAERTRQIIGNFPLNLEN